MLTADPLTNLSARGQATHRETREAVVQALLSSGDTWTRQEVAKTVWKRGDDTLNRLRQQALQAAHAAAEGHRRDLFDMTRAAAHVTGDTLARDTARRAAKRAARKVKARPRPRASSPPPCGSRTLAEASPWSPPALWQSVPTRKAGIRW